MTSLDIDSMLASAAQQLVPHEACFSGACFWTLEAIFQHIRGVRTTTPGYVWMTHGQPGRPSADQHAWERMDIVHVGWDDSVAFSDLVRVWLASTQPSLVTWDHLDEFSVARSAVFSQTAEHLAQMPGLLAEEAQDARHQGPLHTQVFGQLPSWKRAGGYDRSYYLRHPQDGFCRSLIVPKLVRQAERFPELWAPPAPTS